MLSGIITFSIVKTVYLLFIYVFNIFLVEIFRSKIMFLYALSYIEKDK